MSKDWSTPASNADLLNLYSSFHPAILAVLKKAKDIKQWPLLFRAPIAPWHKGKLVLLGDAAHPMLPHQGQGGAQAIEDAIALGISLVGATPEDLVSRLDVYEKVRRNRASVMQQFSNAGQDEPEKIREEAAKFIPVEKVPKTPEQYFEYNFGYDVIRDSVQNMQEAFPGWELPGNFFQIEPVRGTYP